MRRRPRREPPRRARQVRWPHVRGRVTRVVRHGTAGTFGRSLWCGRGTADLKQEIPPSNAVRPGATAVRPPRAPRLFLRVGFASEVSAAVFGYGSSAQRLQGRAALRRQRRGTVDWHRSGPVFRRGMPV